MAIRRSKFVASVSMSSMADIAFLLLIFFMVTSVLKTDADIPLVLPDAQGSELKEKEVIVSIDKNKQYFFNGIHLPLPEVIARVRGEVADKPEQQINIQAHKTLDFDVVQNMIELFKEAGVKKFAMITKNEERKM